MPIGVGDCRGSTPTERESMVRLRTDELRETTRMLVAAYASTGHAYGEAAIDHALQMACHLEDRLVQMARVTEDLGKGAWIRPSGGDEE